MTEGRCPSCGGPVEFSAGSAQVVVCSFCQTVVARKGASLEAHGRIGRIVDTDSPFQLNLHGRYDKSAFTLVGHLQKSQGKAPWDEWYLEFEDGRTGWLAESEGGLHLTFAGVDELHLPLSELTPGHRFTLRHKRFAVEEIHHAKTIAAEGQLPSDVDPDAEGIAVDATGPDGIFVTLDYGTGTEHPEVHFGHEVRLEELGIPPDLLVPRKKKVSLEQIRCSNCNGALELRAPDRTKRIACPYCAALLDASQGKIALLNLLEKPPHPPTIPLGAKGKLKGQEWICIGYLIRSCTVEGVRYPWSEYLLFHKGRGFIWLMESNGHWTLLEPLAAGKVALHEGYRAYYEKQTFKAYQSVHAVTDYVLGEFYWEVEVDEFAEATEYVAPPHSINTDRTDSEITYTFGTYLQPSEVREAFKLDALDTPWGIAPAQPNPHKEKAGRGAKWLIPFLIALVGVHVVASSMSEERVVFERSVASHDGPSGRPELMYFSPPFEIPSRGKLAFTVSSALNNSYIGVQADLLNEATQEVTSIYAEASYYSGYSGGESWSEGSKRSTEYASAVPAGRYTLRLTPIYQGNTSPPYRVELVSGVTRSLWFFLSFLLLLIPLIVYWLLASNFETQRWSESNL